ncbi:MAG: DUF971 domain-containing protein [Nitrospirae bacterium]|nr:DUF971 domain-containing protein [Nitrospirota bacterium]
MTTTASIQPTEIRKETGGLRITWADGHVGLYPHRYLRAHCQCAACVDEWSRKVLVQVERIPSDITPLEIRPVGRYAIHVEWSDGHGTGIYGFSLLRQLCPCERCAPGGPVYPSDPIDPAGGNASTDQAGGGR